MPLIPNDTLSSIINLVNRASPDSTVQPPLSRTAFTLDSSGVAGFFGGESAVRAMSTINLVPQRRWFGWYNSPGSYQVTKQFSRLANSRVFDALFPGGTNDPAKILMLDGQVGPEHTSLYYPSKRGPEPIGHLGSLIATKVSRMPIGKAFTPQTRRTMDARVTFIKLHRIPGELDELDLSPSGSNVLAIGIILISIGGCVGCVFVSDWFCFASIAIGIIANGVAHVVIGSGKPYLKHNPPSQSYAPGDVLLKGDTEIIVLFGKDGSVSPFTRARFLLRLGETPGFDIETNTPQANSPHSSPPSKDALQFITPHVNSPAFTVSRPWILHMHLVDISVILLLSQFLAQLLLIPQGMLFGQIMFVGTLLSSWVYHCYLSSLSVEVQTKILLEQLSIQEKYDIYRYQLNTWTEAVVFTCLAFREIHSSMSTLLPTSAEEIDDAEPRALRELSKRLNTPPQDPETKGSTPSALKAPSASDSDLPAEREKEKERVKRMAFEDVVTGAEERSKPDAMENLQVTQVKNGLMKVRQAEKKNADREWEEAGKKDRAAFRALIDALLPGKTEVWTAFKESLTRKLGASDVDFQEDSKQVCLDDATDFGFSGRDAFATTAQDGGIRVRGSDIAQLRTYQADANYALVAWRDVRTIVPSFQTNYHK